MSFSIPLRLGVVGLLLISLASAQFSLLGVSYSFITGYSFTVLDLKNINNTIKTVPIKRVSPTATPMGLYTRLDKQEFYIVWDDTLQVVPPQPQTTIVTYDLTTLKEKSSTDSLEFWITAIAFPGSGGNAFALVTDSFRNESVDSIDTSSGGLGVNPLSLQNIEYDVTSAFDSINKRLYIYSVLSVVGKCQWFSVNLPSLTYAQPIPASCAVNSPSNNAPYAPVYSPKLGKLVASVGGVITAIDPTSGLLTSLYNISAAAPKIQIDSGTSSFLLPSSTSDLYVISPAGPNSNALIFVTLQSTSGKPQVHIQYLKKGFTLIAAIPK